MTSSIPRFDSAFAPIPGSILRAPCFVLDLVVVAKMRAGRV